MDILFINACVRPQSRTKYLAEAVLKKLGGRVREVILEQEQLSPLTLETLCYRNKCIESGCCDDAMLSHARCFSQADTIVIAAPYWDLSYPSSLKVYVEHIMVNGLTFYYTPEGIPKSLCKAKKLIYVSTAGGPIPGANAGYEYIKLLASLFWGISDTRLFQAENLDIQGADVESILSQTLKEIEDSLK